MRVSWPIVTISCALLLAGCSGVPVKPAIDNAPSSGAALKGIVHGGQQAIVGAHVYLYAANNNGYGNASVSLLTSSVLSQTPQGGQDGSGNYYVTSGTGGFFSITGEYTCPSASSQVYLYAVGGDSGAGTNPAAGLMSGLGSCSAPNFTSQYIVLNEVSTVATAYALAGFATDPTHVSSSNTALAGVGIANAFSSVSNLESIGAGQALSTTPAGNGTVPQQLINTLANILAACINSTGSTSTACSTLFNNAENGTTAPTDTAGAAINIAHNPGANISNLWGLQTPTSPFQTALSVEPNDFTVSITYSGGGLDGSGFAPEGIAVDGSGNVWVPNYTSSSLSEFKFDGTPLSGASGYGQAGLDNPTSVAIDIYGNAWVANFNGNSISEFNSSGAKISGPPGFTGSGLNTPYGVAIDNVGHTWVADFGGSHLSEFQANGAALSGTDGFTTDALAQPAGIAADISGNVWTANYGAAISSLIEVVPNALPSQPPTFNVLTGGGLSSPYGVAIDGTGNVWAANFAGSSVSEFQSNGTAVSPDPAGFTGGGVNAPYGIAVDGVGNVWTANNGANLEGIANSISEFSPSGTAISGSNGYLSEGLNQPYGIAIDPSGNVWVASDNTSGPLTEFVGAAAPVVTPLSAGAAYNELGARP
jgi:streptogramin lyase